MLRLIWLEIIGSQFSMYSFLLFIIFHFKISRRKVGERKKTGDEYIVKLWIHKQKGLLQSQLIISIDHNGFYFCPDSTSSHVCSLFLLLSLQQNAKLLHERMVWELSKMKRKHCLCFKIHINKKMKNENKKKSRARNVSRICYIVILKIDIFPVVIFVNVICWSIPGLIHSQIHSLSVFTASTQCLPK